jgi:hypothetical protein
VYIAYFGVLEDSRDGYGKKVVGQVGWDGMEGGMEFTKSNSNFFKDCRKVGNIQGCVKESTKDFGLAEPRMSK